MATEVEYLTSCNYKSFKAKTYPEVPIHRTIPSKCYLINFSSHLYSNSLGGKTVSGRKRPVTELSYILKKKNLLSEEGKKIEVH